LITNICTRKSIKISQSRDTIDESFQSGLGRPQYVLLLMLIDDWGERQGEALDACSTASSYSQSMHWMWEEGRGGLLLESCSCVDNGLEDVVMIVVTSPTSHQSFLYSIFFQSTSFSLQRLRVDAAIMNKLASYLSNPAIILQSHSKYYLLCAFSSNSDCYNGDYFPDTT
ncbi:hypothetical protein PENTCL1PPCAC_5991, partial [Pristionchus entomophagus]